jgi:PadR family transcriptional regulator PadR
MIHNIVALAIPNEINLKRKTETTETDKKTAGKNQEDEEHRDPKFEKNVISGMISLVLLAITEQSKEPLYGYRISKEMDIKNGNVFLKQGTIYPVLRALERDGLLKSEIRESESGPARKYYWITNKGKETLEIWKGSWYRIRDFVDSIVGGEPCESL